MAEQDYSRGEGVTPIQEMTTRQLRMYIRERAEEARKRVSTISDIGDTPEAFQDQLFYVRSFGSGMGGAIKKDTSRMSKEEMAMYAYALRDLNMLDTESRFAMDEDYRKNKDRYTSFVKKMASEKNLSDESRAHWAKYLTEKGNARKAGYKEYKEFINFLKSIDQTIATYGYETVQDMFYSEGNQHRQELVERVLFETFNDNKGSGKTPADLLIIVEEELTKYDKFGNLKPEETAEPETVVSFQETKRDQKRAAKKAPKVKKGTSGAKKKTGAKKLPKAPKVKKSPAKKGKNDIKTQIKGKLKDATVHEKQGTQKL